MIRRRIVAALVVVLSLLLFAAGCDEDIAGLESLSVRTEVIPETLAPGDSLVARAVLTNYGSDIILVPYGCSGVGWAHVLRAGETVAMEGASVERPVMTCVPKRSQPDTIPVGGSMTLEWPMRAIVDGAPAPPGEYRFRFESTYRLLSDAEAGFTIE